MPFDDDEPVEPEVERLRAVIRRIAVDDAPCLCTECLPDVLTGEQR